MIRAFLAIDLPPSVRPALGQVQEELKKSTADVRWVPVGNIHLTLKFFGQLPEGEVEPLTQAAKEVAAAQKPFELQITGAGAFPSPKNPRVVWVGIGGEVLILAQFYRGLETALAAMGHMPEGRPFHPHLMAKLTAPAGGGR